MPALVWPLKWLTTSPIDNGGTINKYCDMILAMEQETTTAKIVLTTALRADYQSLFDQCQINSAKAPLLSKPFRK